MILRIHILLLVVLFTSGCATRQLRHNTVRHAATLTDLYEHQILNNLARFAVNPETIPHFEIPESGGTNVNDTTRLETEALRGFRANVGLSGDRAQLHGWVLRPVSDPTRLRRIQCAFQRAVGYRTPSCSDCCQIERPILERSDYFTPTITPGPIFNERGKRTVDPITGAPYSDVTYLAEVDGYNSLREPIGKVSVYRPMRNRNADLDELVFTERCAVKPDGTEDDTADPVFYFEHSEGVLTEVTREPFDCDGECAIQPCWFKTSSSLSEARSNSLGNFGQYKGVYVWVPECSRAEFSKLVFTVLGYATTDSPATTMKEVTLYLNHRGEPATRDTASQVVRSSIPATSDNVALEDGSMILKSSPEVGSSNTVEPSSTSSSDPPSAANGSSRRMTQVFEAARQENERINRAAPIRRDRSSDSFQGFNFRQQILLQGGP